MRASHFAKIGPADPDIICLQEIIKKDFFKKKKKKENNESKIYSPSVLKIPKKIITLISVSAVLHQICSLQHL